VIPCPFCGSTDLDAPHEGMRIFSPHCFLMVRCRADGESYGHNTIEPKSAEGKARWATEINRAVREAVEKWNRRAR
jgi:hypothetical protein